MAIGADRLASEGLSLSEFQIMYNTALESEEMKGFSNEELQILKLFALDSGKTYTPLELAKETGIGVLKVRTAVKNLVSKKLALKSVSIEHSGHTDRYKALSSNFADDNAFVLRGKDEELAAIYMSTPIDRNTHSGTLFGIANLCGKAGSMIRIEEKILDLIGRGLVEVKPQSFGALYRKTENRIYSLVN